MPNGILQEAEEWEDYFDKRMYITKTNGFHHTAWKSKIHTARISVEGRHKSLDSHSSEVTEVLREKTWGNMSEFLLTMLMGLLGTYLSLKYIWSQAMQWLFCGKQWKQSFCWCRGKSLQTTSELSQKTGFILGKQENIAWACAAYLPNDHQGAQTCPKGHCISW